MRHEVALEDSLGDEVVVQSSIELWRERCILCPSICPLLEVCSAGCLCKRTGMQSF